MKTHVREGGERSKGKRDGEWGGRNLEYFNQYLAFDPNKRAVIRGTEGVWYARGCTQGHIAPHGHEREYMSLSLVNL